MNALRMYLQMMHRRKTACFWVVLVTAAATFFLLVYPMLIVNTRAELEAVYDATTVTGWLINVNSYDDPEISAEIYHSIIDSPYLKRYEAKSTLSACVLSVEMLEFWQTALEIEASTDKDALRMQIFQAFADAQKPSLTRVESVNCIAASDDLKRYTEQILWAEGYDGTCLAGEKNICMMPAEMGYKLGDAVPMQVVLKPKNRYGKAKFVMLSFTVAGLYPHSSNYAALIPLGTMERIYREQNWEFTVRGLFFEVADNRQLPELKQHLRELDLGAKTAEAVQAVIDDRILDGTVSPVQSNLDLLEGLQKFLYMAVTAIGFFLSFLLARGRKPEFAVMRMLGESRLQVTLKALLEQALLCLLGILLGAAVLLIAGQGIPDPAACGIILGCYTLGAAVAVLLTVRVNVMEILRDKE